ncbi:hypothetical protein LQZ24_05325 [Fructobacillus sp. M1-13]|uniref:Prepilin-type N-terminal cleavage/methylation domain-containing protein n=1 Tax=Fructobacillus papyriferae TaxID=2713171 RepID=A0ABS5QT09_9LACO|nr:hypothetical protein [Fructobacillus papyriferae]MBS9335097.1 hypothetical protein [Fructobacillus papyriferae]MCD2159417.1 hypothetical protein [Fructobacillus papyriferae]
MKQRPREAFTLVESVIVLSLVALLLLLGLQFRPGAGFFRPSQKDFERAVIQSFDQAKKRAQVQNEQQMLDFASDGLDVSGRHIAYPRGYQIEKSRTIKVQESGFIAPQSVYWTKGRQRLRFVIVFGGGDVYFKEM